SATTAGRALWRCLPLPATSPTVLGPATPSSPSPLCAWCRTPRRAFWASLATPSAPWPWPSWVTAPPSTGLPSPSTSSRCFRGHPGRSPSRALPRAVCALPEPPKRKDPYEPEHEGLYYLPGGAVCLPARPGPGRGLLERLGVRGRPDDVVR